MSLDCSWRLSLEVRNTRSGREWGQTPLFNVSAAYLDAERLICRDFPSQGLVVALRVLGQSMLRELPLYRGWFCFV